jgi:hypothetical protein
VRVDKEALDRIRERREELKIRFATDGTAKLPRAKTRKRNDQPFAQIPLHWAPIIQRAKAESAMLLLHAIAYQMRMNQKSRVAITSTTWALAGDPRTEAQRHAVIEVLRRIPSIVRLEFSERTGSKYAAVKGLWWDTVPSQAVSPEDGENEE